MTSRRDTLTLPSGRVITRATADAAADWLTLLMSGEVGDAQQQQWRQWRQAHADHEAAWQHVESVTGRMKSLERAPAYAALSPYGPAGMPTLTARRRATRLLLWGGIATGAGLLGSRTGVWQTRMADYRSGTGEQRNFTLEDGTRLTLNTDSAVNLQFDDTQRRILLVAGEIMVATRHEPARTDARPLLVATAEGTVRSLADLGITTDPQTRQLKLDQTKLDKALTGNPADVTKLLTGEHGLAKNFEAAFKDVLGSTGSLKTRTDGLAKTMSDLDAQQKRAKAASDAEIDQMRTRFVALDKFYMQMQTTANYLTQQFAAMNKSSK